MKIEQIMKKYNEILIDFVDEICYSRPIPNREYDQIYMRARNMISQALLVAKYFKDKDVVFLGDGDGMAILFTLLIENKIIEPFKSILILDFDERIINNSKRIISNTYFGKHCVKYELYNIINPIPSEFAHKYNTFYINPPYGSKNRGLSCKLWLYRCFELCKKEVTGCLILPNDNIRKWTKENMSEIISFLSVHGLIPFHVEPEYHRYFLKDDPQLKSSSILVKGNIKGDNIFEEKPFFARELKNLYGSPRVIPKYIYEDEKDLKGRKDFTWQFGITDFWENELSEVINEEQKK